MRGDRLKALRIERGYSQNEMAHMLGTSQSQVRRWEMGEIRPTSDAIVKLAEFFGVTADYLLGLTDEPDKEITMSDLSPDEQMLIELSRHKVWGRFLEVALGLFQGDKEPTK